MLKAVIFDMDGTLGDTLTLCVETYRQCTEEITGRKPTPAEVVHFFGLSDRGVLGGLLGMSPEDPALPIPRLVEIYESLHDTYAPGPFPGAVDMLKRLKSLGLALGLVSGKEGYTCAPTLRRFGMENLFDWQGLGLPTHNCKSERLRQAMEFFHLAPDELIYVGDAPSDITECRRAGVRIINAAWAPTAAQDAEACLALGPDYRLTDFSELTNLIQQLLS